MEAPLQIKVLLAGLGVENDPKVMPDPLLQQFEDLLAIAVGLELGVNREIADHRAIDFVPEGTTGTDKPATMDDEYRILAVTKGLDDLFRRPPSQCGPFVECGQLIAVVEGRHEFQRVRLGTCCGAVFERTTGAVVHAAFPSCRAPSIAVIQAAVRLPIVSG